MADKYLGLGASGVPTEVEGLVSSSGAGDAGKLVATGTGGKLDESVMPTGIGAEVVNCPASENLSAGDFVNFWSDAGTLKARKADASAASAGKRADGFVKSAVTSGATASVYTDIGTVNANVSGLTIGTRYYLSGAVAGGVTATMPSTTGHLVQEVGVALSATSITFHPRSVAIRA